MGTEWMVYCRSCELNNIRRAIVLIGEFVRIDVRLIRITEAVFIINRVEQL